VCNDGRLCPGLIRDGGVPTSATGRGEARVDSTIGIDEVPRQGLWVPKREAACLEVEDAARTHLASRGLLLIFSFIVLGLVALTWVTLAGGPTDVIGDFLKTIGTPLFGVFTLIVGYYFGRQSREGESKARSSVTAGTQRARSTRRSTDQTRS